MITQENISRLERIVAHYAMLDYQQANQKPTFDRKGNPKRKPYSLSDATMQARDLLHDAVSGKNEEEIKAYLLRQKLLYDL